MHPVPKMEFERIVRNALEHLLDDQGSRIVIDSTRVIKSQDGDVVMVSYHLEGLLESPAQFTFPFHERSPLKETLDAFLDYGKRSWNSAQFAPS